jgi:hypothetical protein
VFSGLAVKIDALPHHRNFLAGNYTGLLEKLASRFTCFAWAQAKFRTRKLITDVGELSAERTVKEIY